MMRATMLMSRLTSSLSQEARRRDDLLIASRRAGAAPLRLVETGDIGVDPVEQTALVDLVRWVRRMQPARRSSGEFASASGWVRLSRDCTLFVQWAVGVDLIDGDSAAPWFADARLWRAPVRDRLAAVFLFGSDELPVLAFDPFSPQRVRAERLFRWEHMPIERPKVASRR